MKNSHYCSRGKISTQSPLLLGLKLGLELRMVRVRIRMVRVRIRMVRVRVRFLLSV